jgi:hypothetical protein
MDKNESPFSIKYELNDDIYEIDLKIIPEEVEKLQIKIENLEEEQYEIVLDSVSLVDIDHIFKKFPEISDIMDIIILNLKEKTLKIEVKKDKLMIIFNVKFIKSESNPKIYLNKKINDEESPILSMIKSLRKEVDQLKLRGKFPIISYVGDISGNNNTDLKGEFNIRYTQKIVLHFFIEYKLNYSTNTEEKLFLNYTNENSNKQTEEKLILKFWNGCYQGGSGYHDSKTSNFMIIQSFDKGKNSLVLRKLGNAVINTLYVIGEY